MTETQSPEIPTENNLLMLETVSAQLAESELNLHNFKKQKEQEFLAMEMLLKAAQDECHHAKTELAALTENFNRMISEGYNAYLRAWPEARIGKLTALKSDKGNPVELFAVALASLHATSSTLKSRKEFEVELHKALGL